MSSVDPVTRPKINFFTPLPPQPTGIADCSVSVLPHLAEIADVRVWTPQDTWDRAALAPLEVRTFRADSVSHREMNWAETNIYLIGNSYLFHREIFEVARRAPGLVILHDTRLQHFFFQFTKNGDSERALYFAMLRRSYGPGAVSDARAVILEALPFSHLIKRYPMTPAAIDNAIGVVMHNMREYDRLMQETGLPLYYVPLAGRLGPAPTRTTEGHKRTKLVLFGFLGDNRRISSVLEALAGLPDAETFTLDIYGSVIQGEETQALIVRFGLRDRVTCHGYVEDAELTRALAHADLALNLRYPSAGEASASQLRIWEACLPSLVTRTGWYETLPADAVLFVDPSDEIETIRMHLEGLRREPKRFAEIGRRGRAHLERHHAPAEYARSLVAISRDARVQHAHRQAIDLARRCAAELRAMPESPTVLHSISATICELVGVIPRPGRIMSTDSRDAKG